MWKQAWKESSCLLRRCGRSGPNPQNDHEIFNYGSGRRRVLSSLIVFPKKISSFQDILPILRSSFRILSTGSKGDDSPSQTNNTKELADKSKADGTKANVSILGEGKPPKIVKVIQKAKKEPLDYKYTGNTFILPVRAMNEYLLKPSHLDVLPKYTRRSPYEIGKPLTMYLRSDVENRAVDIWGSLETLNKEKKKLLGTNRYGINRVDVFRIRNLIEEYRKKPTDSGIGDEKPYLDEEVKTTTMREAFWKSGSGRVVMSAICINAVNSIVKLVAWMHTGSHSMFSEFIHSLADTVNQIILGIGLYHSMQLPDAEHPYGYKNLRNISSLISGVGIFCFGTGLSWYHGIQGFLHPEQMGSLIWAIAALGGALVSEGATLMVAANQVKKGSKANNMAFWQYVKRGCDPNVTVVLLEDMAAVLGVGIAGVCMGITHYTGNPFADSLGSILIGGVLGAVATFIIYTNSEALIGRSIPRHQRLLISQELERDRMVRSLHDVKVTDMGGQVRFKAEIDFDGKEITRAYLYKLDLEVLLLEMQSLKTQDDAETFLLTHGERIIDMLGEEVDRIEKILKTRFPELRHVDLEAL